MPREPREPRTDCFRSCLRGSLRGLNYILAIVGVLMSAYALFMWVQWVEAAAPPAPPPAQGISDLFILPKAGKIQNSLSIIEDDLDKWPDNAADDLFPSKYMEDETASEDTPSATANSYPWFIYIFGGAGLFVFITASVGILSADCAACGVTCFLGLYHALMVLMLLLQVVVVCFYFFDKSWETDIPHEDTTGEYEKMRDIIKQHIKACKIVGLAVLGLQLLSLLVSCSLYYAEGRPRLEYRYLPQVAPAAQEYDTVSQTSLQGRSKHSSRF